jgi:hypothetical protein
MLICIARDGTIRNLAKAEHMRVEIDGSIDIRHRDADGIDEAHQGLATGSASSDRGATDETEESTQRQAHA